MPNKIILYSKKYIILLVIILAAVVFVVTIYSGMFISSDRNDPEVSSNNIPTLITSSSTLPNSLRIPSLDISAKVERVGLTKSGAMAIPSNFTNVAWYKNGPVPGARGNAVINGHVDNALGLPGVFKHLESIKLNENIYVTTASGQMLTFKVVKKETVPYDTKDTARIFNSSSTQSSLILITCGGEWDAKVRSYTTRLIVYTELIAS